MGQIVLIIGLRGFRLRRFLDFRRLALVRWRGAAVCRLFVAALALLAATLFCVCLGRCFIGIAAIVSLVKPRSLEDDGGAGAEDAPQLLLLALGTLLQG